MAASSPSASELLRSCWEDVKKAIKSDLEWIVGELNEEEVVLTNAQYDEVTDPKSTLEPEQKAAKVMGHLLNRLDIDPDYLEDFVTILKEKGSKFRSIIKKLDRGGGGGEGTDSGSQDAIPKVG